jgi:hypothetical protein
MEILTNENLNTLLDEKTKKDLNSENHIENNCVRFMRKKYKCIMLWMLSICCVSQLIILIFDKIDENILNKFLNKFLGQKQNYTLLDNP